MNYSLEEKKKYGFGMNYMIIVLAILVILVVSEVLEI